MKVRNLAMNKIITIIVRGDEYNPTFKWNSVDEFRNTLKNGEKLPNKNDIVIEAYIDDNLIDAGNTFEITLDKLKLILDI